MARFRNTLNGVVVDVDDDTAERLGAAYESADSPASKPAPRKRTTPPAGDD